MKYFVFVVLLTVLMSSIQAQWANGYVVKNSGDTLRGSILVKEETNYTKGVVFKLDGSELNFDQSSIRAFGFSDGDTYRLCTYSDIIKGGRISVFGKQLLKGPLSLFSFRIDPQQFFLIQANQDSTYLLSDDLKTNAGEIIEKGTYLNNLNFLSVSCPDLQRRLEVLNFSEQQIIKYVVDLNRCLQPNEKTETVYKKAKPEKRLIAFVAGVPWGKFYQFTGQVNMRFTAPSISKATSLNTGVSFWYIYEGTEQRYLQTWDHIIKYVSIPFTMQQNFARGPVQPYVYAGLGLVYKSEKSIFLDNTGGFQQNFGLSFIGGIGMEAAVGKHFGIKADWRYELLLHYPVIGITYKF